MTDDDARREIARALHVPERLVGPFPSPSPGQLLYEAFCGSRRTDEARYFMRMNPALKRRWEGFADEVREIAGEDGWRKIVALGEDDRGR